MEEKSIIVSSHDISCDAEYTVWVENLKQSYRVAQVNAILKTNIEKLRLSADNLWAMKRWYSFYADKFHHDEKLVNCVQELYNTDLNVDESTVMPFPDVFGLIPWGYHLDIVRNVTTLHEAIFYIKKTIQESWKRPTLQRFLKDRLYHKQGGAISNFIEQLPSKQAELVQEITKENYNFGFVELPGDYTELNLEMALEQHISRFLLELGNGFSFIGRQKEIVIDGVSRRIDMLFYHIRLHCYIVVELKTVRFEPEFTGKLNFYVNAVNDILRGVNDNPTIGILICSDMKQTEVRYSFNGLSTPIGVATYSNVQIENIERELPSVEQLQQKIKQFETQLSIRQRQEKDNSVIDKEMSNL